MDKKQLKQMLENWVQRDNPKARLQQSDPRMGNKYAVVIDEHSTVTPFFPLNELERFLQGVYQADEYKRKMGIEQPRRG